MSILEGYYGGQVLDVVSNGDQLPVPADPRKEYVYAGEPFVSTDAILAGEGVGCGPLVWHGALEYERMYNTPAVGSSFNALRSAVLAGPVGLLPAIKPKATKLKQGQVEGTNLDAAMAAEIAESNRRTIDAWETPINAVLYEGMEAMYLGHLVAERVMNDVEDGPDAGLLAIKSLRWLPRSSYRFRVDGAKNVVGFDVRTMIDEGKGGTEWETMEAEHFPHLTWDGYRNDPRGRSMFRMAYYSWRMLCRQWPEIEAGWRQFGRPLLWGTTAPGAKSSPPPVVNGQSVAGQASWAPEKHMVYTMQQLQGGSCAAGPNGSTMEVIESNKDSSMATSCVTILEGQIIRSILLQLRATMESEFGSKADSVTAQDVMGTLVRFVRMWLERFIRSVLIGQNTVNYGPDIARRLTPLINLGEHEHQDFARDAGAVGSLLQSGYFTGGQMQGMDERLGLPVRVPGDYRIGPGGVIVDEPPAPQELGPDGEEPPPGEEPEDQAAAEPQKVAA